MSIYRQGDVLFVTPGTVLADGSVVPEMPDDAAPAKSSIIARGDASGHCHVVRNLQKQLQIQDNRMWVDARSGEVYIDHIHESTLGLPVSPVADHQSLVLPGGTYLVLIEEDYTPEGSKYVQD